MSTMETRSMLWFLFLTLSGYNTYGRFEIIDGPGKYPTIVMDQSARRLAPADEAVQLSGGTAASPRHLELAARIGSRKYATSGGRAGGPRNLAARGRGSSNLAKTSSEEEQDNFIKTLQSMVTGDIVQQHSKALKESKYRKLETTEKDPFVWKFFIRPGDLESLLTDKSRLKNFVF